MVDEHRRRGGSVTIDARRLARIGADAVGPLMGAVAEGAWVTVVYLVLELAVNGDRPLGVLPFAAAAGLGMLVGSRPTADQVSPWPLAIALLAAGIAGWLVAGGGLGSLLALDVRSAVGQHPFGSLLALAALRGVLRGRALDAGAQGDTGLGAPTVAIALAWVLGGALAEPRRTAFAAEALGPTVLFLAAGPAGAALTRVASTARTTGFSWASNVSWIAVLAAGLLGAAGIALLAAGGGVAGLAGIAPIALAAVIVVAAISGPEPAGRRRDRRDAAAWLVVVAAIVIVALLPPIRPREQTLTPTPQTVVDDQTVADRQGGTILLLAAGVAGAAIVLLLLRRGRVARLSGVELDEEHSTVVDWRGFGAAWSRPRLARWTRSAAPNDAVEAYRATLDALATDPTTRRGAGETPAAHASRLRTEGVGGLSLELLAADYALARFGGRRLTRSEDQRGVRRWRRIVADNEGRLSTAAMAKAAAEAREGADGAAGRVEARDDATRSRESRV
jgi:hypothetical protein